ncbi:unnamed protein product [Brachionus calyciflorus]|uniref:Uncharacterized protein n=1 Tax=Brachionus calyciflorus TaxID=104777 RepID=A0A814JCK0_9BILA|nr:unnamed protein product [Brachionus calyciflorus]
MGNLYSKNSFASKSSSSTVTNSNIIAGIKIDKLDVRIENKATQIDERSSSVLKYRTPHFRASARIKFPPIAKNETWKVGWIQACTFMQFHNSYGDSGYSSWEFPELNTGNKPMVSDSDGKNFPWYGSKTEVVMIKGPQPNFTIHHVSMNDNFYPHVTWDIPTSSDKNAKLTNIKRDQKFYTWLVAMDVLNGTFVVLKTFKWRMKLEIKVDPMKELGHRAKLISDPNPKQPNALKYNVRIPDCALYPSNANSAQVLIWRSNDGNPLVVVAPKCYNKSWIQK